MIVFTEMSTPDGPFSLVEVEGAVVASGWTQSPEALLDRIHPALRPGAKDLREGEAESAAVVDAYYRGDVAAIRHVPVRQHGTELQRAGWLALREIPAGAPLSYTEFAVALGSPRAVRAAASICARNAPALFVPCHRVLRGDGSLGGFAWGTEVKSRLLARESDPVSD